MENRKKVGIRNMQLLLEIIHQLYEVYLRRERGQGNISFPCSADHKQDWQPYPVDPHSCYMCEYTYIHIRVLYGSTE